MGTDPGGGVGGGDTQMQPREGGSGGGSCTGSSGSGRGGPAVRRRSPEVRRRENSSSRSGGAQRVTEIARFLSGTEPARQVAGEAGPGAGNCREIRPLNTTLSASPVPPPDTRSREPVRLTESMYTDTPRPRPHPHGESVSQGIVAGTPSGQRGTRADPSGLSLLRRAPPFSSRSKLISKIP